MPSEDPPKPEDVNINDIDIWSEHWDEIEDKLTEEQKDLLLQREMLSSAMKIIPTVPCECSWCGNWITETELFYKIGFSTEKIICLSCAGDME